MKKVLYLFMMVLTISMSSCISFVTPDAEEEAVLTYRPWFVGHGGVDDVPVSTGNEWVAWSTHADYFKITSQRYDEEFDDIWSDDRTPLDFNSYINIKIISGKTPILLKNYGKDWYVSKIQGFYRNYTREEVSKYSPFDLISNREVLAEIDKEVLRKMQSLLDKYNRTEGEFPIIIESVITGAAKPNKEQLDEMNRTAQAIQAKTTQIRQEEMHHAREAAELARAKADKAYQNAMDLSSEQFIQLKYIEMIADKKDANIDVLIGGGASNMWNIRR